MEKRKKIAACLLTCSLLLCSVSVSAAEKTGEDSAVRKNIDTLIKTKSCPGCNLAGANLNRADLAGADLQGADLSRAKFFLTNLSGANLQKANLTKAGFGGADLANADLRGADLADANFDGAYLKGVKSDKEFKALLQAGEQKSADIEAEIPAEPTPAAEPEAEIVSEAVPEPAVQQDASIDQQARIETGPPATSARVVEPEKPSGEDEPAQSEIVPEVSQSADSGFVGQESTGQDQTAQPSEPPSAVQEAPPVKTVQPMGEAVVTEPEKVEAQPEFESGQAAVSADPGGSPAPVEKVSTVDEDKVASLLKSKKCYSCDLSGLNLSGRNLKGADLEKANLTGCNLEGASLDRANLKGAILIRANLRKASLQGADLYKADFTGADLTDADMKKVQADDALFTDAIGVSDEVLKQKQ